MAWKDVFCAVFLAVFLTVAIWIGLSSGIDYFPLAIASACSVTIATAIWI